MSKCITPLAIIDKIKRETIPVPCGRCFICIKKRTSQWSFRLRKEGESSSSSYFITLTYDTKHVPISKNGFMTLNPDDITKFLKRLRKEHKETIKYYYVGEYGGKTMRPHYHMIIYNADREIIDKIWNKGAVHYGDVNGASIGYTLKYMIKDGKIPMHRNDDRLREFGRMSKGLGLSYLTPEVITYHTKKTALLERSCCIIDGKKVSMPRYYKEKLYNEQQKLILQNNAKELQKKLDKDREKVDISREIQAHLHEQSKLFSSKYKNKHI